MEEQGDKGRTRRKGGRPPKKIKRDQLVGVKCSRLERTLIEHRAKLASMSVSEYLRTLALHPQQVVKAQKSLPKEVLTFTGTLLHLAANMNQIAFHQNRGDQLTVTEKETLALLVIEVKNLAQAIKTFLR